ncbi:sodium/hydrogen exchanger 10-like, partial [Asbolus verrucosus]
MKRYRIPLHYTIFAIIAGFITGIMAFRLDKLIKYKNLIETDFLNYLYFYVSGLMFKTTFGLDTYIFQKTFVQILIIAQPISILTGCLFGILIKLTVTPQWSFLIAIMLGMFCTPINSSYMENHLKRLAAHMKHTHSLLDGESIIAVINSYILYMVALGYFTGFINSWSYCVWVMLRLLIVGLPVGCLFGFIGQYLLKQMYSDHLGVVMLSFGLPFFTFGFTEIYFGGCGAVSVLILGVIMAKERSTLSPETDTLLNNFWKTIEKILNLVTCLVTGMYMGLACLQLKGEHYVYVVVMYFLYYFLRFMLFLFFVPILSRIGYGMNIKTMMICVIGGLKAPFSFIFAMLFVNKGLDIMPDSEAMQFYFYITLVYLLSYTINGVFLSMLLKVMGVSKISMVRQLNMNNCMKHILAKRERTLWILKMDRYLSDANWGIASQATVMKHPFNVDSKVDDEEDDYFLGYRYTFCPDCKKEVAEEPTQKELKEMAKEAKMRLLKAKKASYSRQYENGMVSKEGIRILGQAVELAMDMHDIMIQVDGLHKKFNREGWFRRFLRKRVQELSRKKEEVIRPPRKYWRRLCYYIAKSITFDVFVYVVNFINAIFILLDLFFEPKKGTDIFIVVAAVHIICFKVYLFEFIVKIMSYSHIYIWRDGFRIYFKSCWNLLDFIVLIIFVVDFPFQLQSDFISDATAAQYCHRVMNILKILRLLKLLKLSKILYPKVIKYLDSKVDANMAITYELGKAYAAGEEEVVKLIPQIVDHEKIQDELRHRMEQDRVTITKLLGVVQKERPWIAITVKTKQAIRTIINSMKEALFYLKATGWTDNYEHKKLMISITELYKYVGSIKTVQPSAPKVIFKEVPWMAGDEAVFDFLFENVTVKKFEPGDVVFGEGKVADGIYIVVTGLFLLSYTPDMSVLTSLKEYGILPIVDYVSGMQYVENVSEYIVSGNCIGELSTLTGRAYNCTITAEAHSQVYVLSHGIIKRAMELSPDFINGLECRIWKAVSIRIAVPILMAVPTYHTYSLDQLKYTLERAFLPNLENFKIFTMTEMIQDILLIEGVARDFNTRELFVAPYYIPRTVQKLILPASSLINIPINIETRLLIIPETGVDEFDVMLLAEETCEMVATGSESKCLLHTIQNRSSRMRRRNRAMEDPGSVSRKNRYKSKSTGNLSSRYT